MKTRIAIGITSFVVLGLLGSPGAARAAGSTEDVTKEPGYVDFGIAKVFGAQQADVEVLLEKNLINMVAAVTKSSDPELADMLAKLKQIRVQTFAIEPDKLEAIESKTREVVGKLESQGWSPMVKVRDRKENSQTYVYAKMSGEKMQGLVVMNVDPNDEAAFINIVGEIDPAQLGKLQHKFDIEGLDSLGTEIKHEMKSKSEKSK